MTISGSSALAGAWWSPLGPCTSSAAQCTLLLALLAASGTRAAAQPAAEAVVPAQSASSAVVLPALGGDDTAAELQVPAAEQAPAPALPDFLPGELPLAAAALPAEEPAQPAAEAAYPFTTPDPFVGTAIPSEGPPDPFAETVSGPPAAEAEAAALPAAQPLPLEATALPTAQGLPDDVSAVLGSGGTAAGSSAAGGGGSQPLPEVLAAASPPPAVSSDLLPDPSKRTGRLLSLLNPLPAGYAGPPLTQQQQDMVPRLRQLRLGKAIVGVRRPVGSRTKGLRMDVGMLGGGSMACGIAYLNDHFQDFWVGLPVPLFHEAELCGACVRMWCVDTVCNDALVKSDLFMITDSCKECGPTDLLASGPGLTNLSGGVSVDLTPKFQAGRGGAVGFSNLKSLLKAVAVGGIVMQRTNYGYWVIDTPGQPIPLRLPLQLDLLSVKNERLTVKVPTLRAQDLGVNFKS
ncbi:hypothetical protein ABPG77_003769 [Micractinium sp. CCAP 211/92]